MCSVVRFGKYDCLDLYSSHNFVNLLKTMAPTHCCQVIITIKSDFQEKVPNCLELSVIEIALNVPPSCF